MLNTLGKYRIYNTKGEQGILRIENYFTEQDVAHLVSSCFHGPPYDPD